MGGEGGLSLSCVVLCQEIAERRVSNKGGRSGDGTLRHIERAKAVKMLRINWAGIYLDNGIAPVHEGDFLPFFQQSCILLIQPNLLQAILDDLPKLYKRTHNLQ